jgi:hypothetical protein
VPRDRLERREKSAAARSGAVVRQGAVGNPAGRPKGIVRAIREQTRDGDDLVTLVVRVFRGDLAIGGVRRLEEEYRLPALVLPDPIAEPLAEGSMEAAERPDPVETWFIRVNSAGSAEKS